MTVRRLVAGLLALTAAACAEAGPQVTIAEVPWVSDDPTDPRNCADSYPLMLTVTEAGREVGKGRYCEYPDATSARVYKDRQGHIYVFVVTDQYHGTGLHPTELHVKRVNVDRGTLDEVATLQFAALDGGPRPDQESRWDSAYDVRETDSGSLQLVVTYAPGPRARCCAPEKQVRVRLGP